MEDAQVPADGDDKGEARRPGRRLSDAESVATTRRDMFGDGSLLDALASPPAAPDVPDAAPAGPPAPQAGDAGGADPYPPGQLASFPQPLDEIIDSFPAGSSARGADGRNSLGTSPGFLPPPRLTAMEHGLGTGNHAPDPSSGVSAIFNTLSPLDGHSGEPQLGTEASPSNEGPGGTAQMTPVQGDGPHGDQATDGTPAATPALETLNLPPLPEIPGPPHPEAEGMPLSDAGMPQFAEPLRMGGTAPFSEPSEYSEDTENGEEYPEGMPRFAEPLRIGGVPSFADPPTLADDAAYPVVQATEPFSHPSAEVSGVPPYAEVPSEVAPPSPPPLVHSSGSEAEAAAAPMFDAAAKIAAEATATAEALENLKRLLVQNVPGADTTQPTQPQSLRHGYQQMHFQPDPAPYGASSPSLLMPLPVPAAAERSRSIYVLGFLTGLGLSLMAGVALYFLINVG
jgi:hypothetical protein